MTFQRFIMTFQRFIMTLYNPLKRFSKVISRGVLTVQGFFKANNPSSVFSGHSSGPCNNMGDT